MGIPCKTALTNATTNQTTARRVANQQAQGFHHGKHSGILKTLFGANLFWAIRKLFKTSPCFGRYNVIACIGVLHRLGDWVIGVNGRLWVVGIRDEQTKLLVALLGGSWEAPGVILKIAGWLLGGSW